MRLLSLEEAVAARVGRRLVTTNGVYDILHAGHVACIEAARGYGDVLFVLVNTDESVRRLGKGTGRPVNSFEDRARVVAALRCVDAVVALDDDTPVAVLSLLRPEVHVKGGDYAPEALPEARVVIAAGGRVEIVPTLLGRSTTRILKAISALEPEG